MIHAFGTRETGTNDERPMADLFGIRTDSFLTGTQVHGNHITLLDAKDPSSRYMPPGAACDGFVTNRPRCAVGIRTADCIPLLLADPARRVVGAIHAGWKGTALGIAAQAIALFVDRFSCGPSDIIAVIGPAIGPCCYEVGNDVYEAMGSRVRRNAVFSDASSGGRRMLDLPGANRHQLLDAGLSAGNIITIPLCTACRRDLFHSRRAEGTGAGRQVSGIMLL
ncbi:MAG: peptidoglycan editing factor PgeF [Syntrophales bacterium]|jgi:YfiH family protein|nr:peptidoglycan editing factor PgeF [Syntrophales bacterium]